MKIVAIGDTHGRSDWKKIVKKEKDADKIIFIGDYFDTHESISAGKQIQNFKDIIEFYGQNPARTTLILGNHDYHYLPGIAARYSGFNFKYEDVIRQLLIENITKLKIVKLYDNTIFSHAGLTKTWLDNHAIDEIDVINQLFEARFDLIEFSPGTNNSNYGDDITQSPIWVREGSLMSDAVDGWNQVVGHTTQQELSIYEGVGRRLAFIDCIGTSGEYLVIEDGKFRAEKIN